MDELKVTDYILFGLVIWMALLTIFVFQAVSHYRKLARGANIQDLGKILERIISKQDSQNSQTAQLIKEIENQKIVARAHFTKHSLIRFNPFEESGGDQSFTVALLDSNNNGIVLSSLHSRSGTRIYAKEVVAAHATNHKFSKEEKEAVEKTARHVHVN